ncbi:DUF4214 domain-containing protein [Pseudoduganella sp. FT26W]|uniref:DUF4214 domain-containing protein n=1 Tax=Duganella aquatilis TaxID=2666082 RepID=A0A844DGZ6_9BURK|nr:DUF4214 domain-containing protein [Duganella aquatilis]MRW88160.1 DUF4214 domain-containing protein [Duganella aquatilis]
MATTTAATATDIQTLYVAYFNRPADPLGLQLWLNSGASIQTIANGFSGSDEYKATYAGKTPLDLVDSIYMNLFGRHAESAGLLFWAARLQGGQDTFASIVLTIAKNAQDDGTNNDLTAIQSKVAAATAFTTSLDTAAEIRGYDGAAANAVVKQWLAGVTNPTNQATATTDAALQAVSAAATAAHDNTTNNPLNITLTAGVDTGAAFVGGAGNDTFNASTSATGVQTFSALDTLDGGAGIDTLNIIDTVAAGTAFTVAPSAKVSNIEIANITSANNTVTADVSGWTGLTNLNVVSTGGATLTAANTTAVAATDSVLAAGAIVVTGGASATVAATKVNGGTINVSGVAGDVVVTAGATAGTATATVGTVTVNGGKTVTVTENLTASTADVTKAVTGGSVNVNGSAATTSVSVKQTASAAATTSVGQIVAGAVTIKDVNFNSATAAGTITTATVDGYKTGSSVQSNALSSLTLANSDAAAAFGVIANNATAAAAPTTLKLTVNNAAGTLDLENAGTAANKVYKTLNITTATKDSALAVTGSIVETLTIAGTNGIDLSSSSLAALKTVTVSGAAGVKGDFSTANVTSVDASASSGKNTVTVDATKATYKGGSGVDIVTLTAAAPVKSVSLGAGDDTIVLQSLATNTGVTIDGGTGTNTVQTTFALASSNADAHTELVNFSKLAISTLADASAGAKTIDLVNFGTKSYIDLILGAKTAAAGADLTIGSLDSNGTIEFNAANTGAGKVIVAVTNAASNTADVLNVKLNATASGATTAFDTVQASNVETVNVSSTTGDTTAVKIAADINTLSLSAAQATTVTVTGNVALDLTGSVLTAATKVDASAATGGVKVDLSAAAGAVTYLGGSGVDTVKLNSQANIVTLGGGKDVVDATTATSTATVFSTIKDIAAGDSITFAAVTKDITGAAWTDGAKLGAAITSPFGDIFSLLNAATASDGTGHAVTWFQFGGDTYIVQDNGSAGTFAAGSDLLIKLTGIHDLTNSTLASAGGLTVV